MFFRKDNNDNERPDDFVLFNEDSQITEDSDALNDDGSFSGDSSSDDGSLLNKNEDFVPAEIAADEDMQTTKLLNTQEISEALDSVHKENSMLKKASVFIKSHRLQTIIVCIVLIAAIIGGAGYGAVCMANPLRNYVQYAASKENIVSTMEAEGVLASGDKYEIVSLVSGKIAESKYDVGDKVSAGDVLYKLDDTEAKLALERAKNELSKASDSASGGSVSTDTGRIIAPDAGTIESMTVKQGSVVTAGSQIGMIKKSDGSKAPIISYVSGTVSIVSASVGRSVSSGQLIASVKLNNSSSSNKDTSKYDKKSSEIDVQAAEKQLEAYTVKSPIDGVIIEKNNKAGDNVGDANSYKPMMVVLDTSKLTLTFSVDESRISEVEKGQPVTITSDSVPDTKFSGEVSSVGVEGKTDENGKVSFDVTVAVTEPEELKAGMKVKAKVILDTANSSTTVPQNALLKSDGQNALVIVKNDDSTSDKDISESIDNQLNHPEIKVPKGCSLVSVKYGISDGTNVQIISGLKVGEVIAYNPKADYGAFVKATGSNTSADSNSNTNKSDSSENNSGDDSAVEKQVEERMNNMLKNSSL